MSADAFRTPLDRAASLIELTPDYPKPGVLFRDIAPMLADAAALRAVTDALLAPFAGRFDLVAGVEARGFLLAGAAAATAGVGLIPIRKAGKIPNPAASVSYALEYGSATIEINHGVPAGSRVLLLDDVIATGGTFVAARTLIERVGATLVGASVVLELDELGGRAAVEPVELHAVFHG